MMREPTVATAIDTRHHVATFSVTAVDPRLAAIVAGMSGAIAARLPSSVRRGVLGTMMARARIVLAHASRPAYAPTPASSPAATCNRVT